jgi:hypothetical protein
MPDEGVHSTLEDLHPSYVSGILRLTLLAPEIVGAILVGRQPAELPLDDLLAGFPLEWKRQSDQTDTGDPHDCGRSAAGRLLGRVTAMARLAEAAIPNSVAVNPGNRTSGAVSARCGGRVHAAR